jgi:hypothetical protein
MRLIQKQIVLSDIICSEVAADPYFSLSAEYESGCVYLSGFLYIVAGCVIPCLVMIHPAVVVAYAPGNHLLQFPCEFFGSHLLFVINNMGQKYPAYIMQKHRSWVDDDILPYKWNIIQYGALCLKPFV